MPNSKTIPVREVSASLRKIEADTVGRVPIEQLVSLTRVHDVRHLAICAQCGQLGDNRRMISVESHRLPFHGRCFIGLFGLEALLRLSPDDTDALTLGDIGVAAMKTLVDRPKWIRQFNREVAIMARSGDRK